MTIFLLFFLGALCGSVAKKGFDMRSTLTSLKPMSRCHSNLVIHALLVLFLFLLPQMTSAQEKPRARDLGIPFEGIPGPLNAITDVKGVEVGHTTIISGEGELKVGVGRVQSPRFSVFF